MLTHLQQILNHVKMTSFVWPLGDQKYVDIKINIYIEKYSLFTRCIFCSVKG